MGRALRHWGFRLVLLGLVIWLLSTQIRWQDSLEREGKSTLRGRVERVEGAVWQVTPDDGTAPTRVPDAEVRRRGEGDRAVPAVTWGLRTLGTRLSGRPRRVAVVLLVLCALIALTAWRWHGLLAAVGLHVGRWSALRLTWIGSFFNLAVPGSTGGDVVKAYYAARTTGRPTRAVLSVFVDRVAGLLGLAVFAGVVLLVAPAREGYAAARTVVLVVLGTAVVGGVVLLAPGLRRALGLGRLMRRLPGQGLLAEAREALRLYRGRPGVLVFALGISLVNHASVATCAWLLAGALGMDLDLGVVLALVPIANLFSAVPLLPGGWGVGELAFAWLFGQVGVPATEAVGLSVVYRLSILVASLPGGAFWLFWQGRPSRQDIRHEVEEAAQALEARDAATTTEDDAP